MITQIIANGLIASSVYLLVALGFGLIYSTTRFFHFAHGAVFAAAPYAAFFFIQRAGVPLPLALVGGIGIAMGLGCLIEQFVYRPLGRYGAGPLVLLLASLGLYIVLQNLISVLFGDDAKSLRSGATQVGLSVFRARVTVV